MIISQMGYETEKNWIDKWLAIDATGRRNWLVLYIYIPFFFYNKKSKRKKEIYTHSMSHERERGKGEQFSYE
jgi:hypothetical protein